jgi:hypothetical protein
MTIPYSRQGEDRHLARLHWLLFSSKRRASIGFFGFLIQVFILVIVMRDATFLDGLAGGGAIAMSTILLSVLFWGVWWWSASQVSRFTTELINQGEDVDEVFGKLSPVHDRSAVFAGLILLVEVLIFTFLVGLFPSF